MKSLLALILVTCVLPAQEAGAGFELRSTLTAGSFYSQQYSAAPRSDGPANVGFRSVFYPTWKLSRHWSVSAAWQLYSRPYFFEESTTQGRGVRPIYCRPTSPIHAFRRKGRSLSRAGELSSAFGAFLLRYDDAVNPLVDMPPAYGYYYKGVTTRSLPGVQADVTLGKLDLRAQFTNSSPANRRSIFDSEQYGAWTAGTGYTIFQGLRIGAAAYRGPYLHRQYAYYFPGEALPRSLTGSAEGLDVQFARGHWNINGELQRFRMDYVAIPTFRQHTGYAEVRRVLTPRWYVAARAGYVRANAFSGTEIYDFAVGYRPNRLQLIKAGYQMQKGPAIRGTLGNTISLQLVTSLRLISIARD